MMDLLKNLILWRKVVSNDQSYVKLQNYFKMICLFMINEELHILFLALQDTVGVMQKFREEELKRRQQILQEQQYKLSGMLITDDML